MDTQPEWGKAISKYFCLPQRVIFAIMGFFSIVVAYGMRINLSLAIVELVSKDRNAEVKHQARYDWSEEHQGMILSSFYLGYIVTHVPGGVLADKFGGRWTLSLGILLSVIFTLLTPVIIRHGGSYALIGARIIIGLGQGTVYPALTVLLTQWVPKKERGRLGAFVFGGGQMGTVLANSVSGLLLDAFEWDWAFYFFGIVGLAWFFLFILLCYSDPASHPFIKQSEKDYLNEEMGRIAIKADLPPTPWKGILTNIPFISVIVAQIGHDWGFFVMVTDLPKYMADVMGFSIKQNGFLSSLPYLAMWVVSVASGGLSDWMVKKGWITTTNARKLFSAISQFGPAVFIVLASYAGYDRVLVVTLFTIAMGLMGTFYAGMKLTPLDLSPNYSGTLTALTNGIGAITGVLAPYFVGVMTPHANLLEWRMVFWLAFIILVGTTFMYIFCATADIQDFNDPKPKDAKE